MLQTERIPVFTYIRRILISRGDVSVTEIELLCKENNIQLVATPISQLVYSAKNALCKKYGFAKFDKFPRHSDGSINPESVLKQFLKTQKHNSFKTVKVMFDFDGINITEEAYNKIKDVIRKDIESKIPNILPDHHSNGTSAARAKYVKSEKTTISVDQKENPYIIIEKNLDEIFLKASLLNDVDIIEDIRVLRRKVIKKI